MTAYEKRRELIFSIAATLVSALLLAQSFRYAAESSGFPRFLTGLMLFFSLILLGRNLLARGRDKSAGKPAGAPDSGGADNADDDAGGNAADPAKSLRIAGCVIGGTALYAFAMLHVGYFVSTTVFFLVAMVLFGKNKALVSLVASASFMTVMYGLFVWFLGMRLPEGLLF